MEELAALIYSQGLIQNLVVTEQVRRLRRIEEENARLKRVAADLKLDKISCSTSSEKGLTPTRRREVVQWIIDMCKVGVEHAYRLGNFSSGS